MFNKAFCPDGYTDHDYATNGARAHFGDKACLVVSEFDVTTIAQRYDAVSFSGCDNVATATKTSYATIDTLLRDYHSHLLKYDADVQDVFTRFRD